jgi:hypothetical protein
MNIKINKSQAQFILDTYAISTSKIGSHLYGVQRTNSDTDYLVLYKSFHETADMHYPNFHQFQWDDTENNAQYIFSSERQFWKNLFSGDSTINADVILFSDGKYNDAEKLNITRTFNIIKAFLGFAKRDIKQIKGKNKIFHINRGLYCAESLLENRLPLLSKFIFNESSVEKLAEREAELRARCNIMLEKNELTLYPKMPVIQTENELEKLLIDANNIKEFRYF